MSFRQVFQNFLQRKQYCRFRVIDDEELSIIFGQRIAKYLRRNRARPEASLVFLTNDKGSSKRASSGMSARFPSN